MARANSNTITIETSDELIEDIEGALVGGDKSVSTARGAGSLDIQSARDAVDLSHLYLTGSITSFEDMGSLAIKAHYDLGDVELKDGASVTITDNVDYNGTYIIFNVITDSEDSFQFTAVWTASGTATLTAQTDYDRLRPNENKNDPLWSLEAQTEFFAEAPESITIGKRNKTLKGWEGDWSSCIWGIIAGFQNIGGGKGTSIFGNNNIAENYWTTIFGNHNHVSEWSSLAGGAWNILQGGDCMGLGFHNNTYGWKNQVYGTNNDVAGNENQSYGANNKIHDAYGATLNQTPDDVHNRYNLIVGSNCAIGSELDLGHTINNAVLLGNNLNAEEDGVVCVGRSITNTHANSIEIGVSDSAKLAVRSNGSFIMPAPDTTEPTIDTLPLNHVVMWYGGIPEKLRMYRNVGNVIESVDIGGTFA